MPGLAMRIGLNESIFLQQLHYWLDRSVNVKEGHRWVYNTAKEWQEQFPFWSVNTIRRIIKSLEEKGFVIIDNFNSLPIDKTNWYRINYEKIEALEVESVESEKSHSSTQNEHSKQPTWVDETPKLGKPLPEITTEITTENNYNDNARAIESPNQSESQKEKEKENPFSFFEQNGFGALGIHIGDKIGAWIEDLSEELVLQAMKIAVENGAINWNYVETILRDWSSKRITSLQEYEAHELKRKNKNNARSNARRYGQPVKEELVPAWFKEQEASQVANTEPLNEASEDMEERRRKLREELAKTSSARGSSK